MGITVICPHIHTDFDAFGSAVGVALLYPDGRVLLPSDIEEPLRDFIKDLFPDLLHTEFVEDVEQVVIVDTSSPDRIDCPLDLSDKKIIIIDHHPDSNFSSEPNITRIVEQVGSTSTIVTNLLMKKGIKIPEKIATALLAGIYEDTGYFSFSSVTPEDFKTAAFLLKSGADLEIVTRYVRFTLQPSQVELLQEMINEGEIIKSGDFLIGIVVLKLEKYIPDISLVMNHYLSSMELDAAFVLLQTGEKIQIIGRSRNKKYSVLEVLKRLGGGGHEGASSVVIRNTSIPEALKILKNAIEEKEGEEIKAGDIMFSNLITVGEGRRIEDAAEIFGKYNFNVLPVINSRGKLSGIITRQIVDKLLYHNLGKARVGDFMLRDIGSVTPDDPVSLVKEIMMKRGQRFVPVVKDGFPVGGITRKELLKHLFPGPDIDGGFSASKKKNLKSLIDSSLEREVVDILREIGETAIELGMKAYLVGGFVRDLILRRKNYDLDIVVEGDAIELADIFAREKGLKVKKWDRFGTARLFKEGDFHIDLSTARIEYYTPENISYPVVTKGTLYQDLYRRDFTINAMALSINPDNFGDLVDPFHGLYDLKKKVIRVIHQLSFIEDPARIIRAARFAGKLGFKIGRGTRKIMKSALQLDIFRRFPTGRLFHEFDRVMEEENVPEIFLIMEKEDILERLVRGIKVKDGLLDIFEKVRDTLLWFRMLYTGEKIEEKFVYWLAFASYLGEEKIRELFDVIVPDKNFEIKLLNALKSSIKISEILKLDLSPGELSVRLENVPVEYILYLFSVSDENVRKKLSEYLQKWRNLRPEITGRDLIKLGLKPGPLFGEILKKLHIAKIEKDLKDRKEELQYLKKRYPQLFARKKN